METNTVTPTNYLTHPKLQHLTTLVLEHQRRSPMMKRICQVLACHPHGARNMTREEVMLQAHAGPEPFRPTSNGSYWRRMWTGQLTNAYDRAYHDEARYSVIINGLVRIAGKRGRRYTYELTPAGELFAFS